MSNGKKIVIFGVLLIVISLFITFNNKYEEIEAGNQSKEALSIIKDEIVALNHSNEPIENETEITDMKTVTINGEDYIGTITIPSINLELPVISEYSYNRLKKAPCRYYGNIYSNDLIICAHAYKTHFRALNKVKQNDLIIFTTIDGKNHIYEVLEIEVLNPTDVDKMINNEFDLTLYTCTSDNNGRITIRCNKVNA